MMRRSSYYYEIKSHGVKVSCAVRFADFHLRYLMARKMACIASRNCGSLTIKKLTLVLAIKHRFFNSSPDFLRWALDVAANRNK